jgi:hypothetical protein
MLSIITGRARFVSIVVWALLAQGALWGVACDKLPLLAPSGSAITLSSNTTIVQSNGVAEIRATVLESSGTPVQNGTLVTFTTNLGTLSPNEARTINGTATVQFVGNGQSGEAEISATSGGAKPESTLKLKVGVAATGRIQVTANPSTVPASGGSSTISATVFDTNGNPLSGIPVSFSTDFGSLSSTSATTSSSGVAQVVLTTNRDATVTASAGLTGGTSGITGSVKVIANTLPTLAIEVTTATPTEDQATNFRITAGPAAQDSFQSVTVNFGDGNTRSLGPMSAGTSTTVSNVYRSDGTFTVTVTGTGNSGGTQRATAVVTINPRAAITATVTATPTSGPVATLFKFDAAVSGAAETNISSYRWDFGDGVVDTGGKSTTHKYALPNTYVVRVTVTTGDGNSGSGRTEVLVTP